MGEAMTLDARVPPGPMAEKWTYQRSHQKLVNPANKRRFTVIVVGSGLAGGAGAASLAELGYNVKCFCYQDSPRRAHSIAAQGGINAAKNYQNDGDSVFRLFYDTVKGGDFRAREANVYRLAETSVKIIDQCAAQGVPFAREYGGLLANRSFGGAQVSRTFYARGQTGQQLLLGAYSALERQIGLGTHAAGGRNTDRAFLRRIRLCRQDRVRDVKPGRQGETAQGNRHIVPHIIPRLRPTCPHHRPPFWLHHAVARHSKQPPADAIEALPWVGPVAQWLEPAAHNRLVAGSSPAGPTSRHTAAGPRNFRHPPLGSRCSESNVARAACPPQRSAPV